MLADLISSLLPRAVFASILENPAWSPDDPKTWEGFLEGHQSEAGIRVTHRKALRLAAVWQAMSTISGDMASIQLDVVQRLADDDVQIDRQHNAELLVSTRANPETPAYELWRRGLAHAALWQNGYIWIDRLGNPKTGRPVGLYNLLPDRTRPARTRDGELFYVTEVDGHLEALFKEEVLHIKGLSFDNGIGLDLVLAARDSWGLALAAQDFASKFFANGAQSSGILEVPTSMTPKAANSLEEGFRREYTGKGSWFKVIVLRDGAKFHQTSIDAQKSQMHELRQDQVLEVARFFNLPPYKLGLTEGNSQYKSPEQAQIVYLTGCLNHWRNAVTSECNLKLLSEEQIVRGTHWFRHNLSQLIEIDLETMEKVREIRRRNKVINANEWRQEIGLPRRQDPEGDSYENPSTSAKDTGTVGPESPKALPAPGKKNTVAAALRQLLTDAVGRLARRVTHDARTAARKPAKFLTWLDSKGADHRPVFAEALRPVLDVVEAIAGQEASVLLVVVEGLFFTSLLKQLAPLVEPPHSHADLPANVDRACTEFERTAAASIAAAVFPEEQES